MEKNKQKVLKSIIFSVFDPMLSFMERRPMGKELSRKLLFQSSNTTWIRSLSNNKLCFIELIMSQKRVEFTFRLGWYMGIDLESISEYNMLETVPTANHVEFYKSAAVICVGRLLDSLGKRPLNQRCGDFWWRPEFPIQFTGNSTCTLDIPFELKYKDFDWSDESVIQNVNSIVNNSAEIVADTALPYLKSFADSSG